MAKFRITYNAPVILTFALAAVAVHILRGILSDEFILNFMAWPEFVDSRSYWGLVTHILGHGDWPHLLGNFTMILLIGPILEERYGSLELLGMILLTALAEGLFHTMFFSSFSLGASGIVFMLIILVSTVNIRGGEIPLTFIAVALLYLGSEIVGLTKDDGINHAAHLFGGATGAVFGFILAGTSRKSKALDKAVSKAIKS